MDNDNIQVNFEKATESIVWVKMTIGAFRWLDLSETYRDLGWAPKPLLVTRDVRAAYASLMRKSYGFNGTTGDEPPLRMRFRRFLADWELFCGEGWPILKYEELMIDERAALTRVCQELDLPWDEAMVSWPKRMAQIAYPGDGPNATFEASMGKGSFAAAKVKNKAKIRIDHLPDSELAWLEDTFAEYNRVHGYPEKVTRSPDGNAPRFAPPPRFEGTRRHSLSNECGHLREELLTRDLAPLVPSDGAIILVENNELGTENGIAGRRAIPFLEHDGQYWGAPEDDQAGIRELERLRAAGAGFIAFAAPAFWWLDHYKEFARHVREHFQCVLENDRMIMFDLRSPMAATRTE